MAKLGRKLDSDEVPTIARSGGGPRSEVMQAIYDLGEKQSQEIDLSDAEDFDKAANSTSSMIYSATEKLGWSPTVQRDPDNRCIYVTRAPGSGLVHSDNGGFKRADNRKDGKPGRYLTVADLEKAQQNSN